MKPLSKKLHQFDPKLASDLDSVAAPGTTTLTSTGAQSSSVPPRPASSLGQSSSKPLRSSRHGESSSHKRHTSTAPDPRLEKIERVKRRLGEGFPVDLVFPDNHEGLSSTDRERKTKSVSRSVSTQAPRPPWMVSSVEYPPDKYDSGEVPLLKSRRNEARREKQTEKLMIAVGMNGVWGR